MDQLKNFRCAPAKVANELRRAGRLHAREVTCDFGQVVDLSANGLRAIRRGRPPRTGEQLTLTITSAAGELSLRGTVVRVTRTGMRTHEIGVQFQELDEPTRAGLTAAIRVSMARTAHD